MLHVRSMLRGSLLKHHFHQFQLILKVKELYRVFVNKGPKNIVYCSHNIGPIKFLSLGAHKKS